MRARPWHALFFTLALAVSGLALAPASMFITQRPGTFTFESVSGPIWNARMEGVRIGPIDAGIVRLRLSPRSALSGAIASDVTMEGGTLSGDLSITVDAFGARRVQAGNLVLLGAPIGAGAAPDGRTTVSGLDIMFQKGRCQHAEGQLASDVLEANAATLRFRGPPLAGAALCGDDAAWLPWEGANGAERYRSVIVLRPNGEARWQADVVPGTMEVAAVLSATGFVPVEGEPYVQLTRTFQWLPL